MKRLRIIGNTLKASLKNIFKNPLITLASLTTMTLMLMVLGAFFFFYVNANNIMEKVGQAPPVTIWVRENVTDAELEDLEEALDESKYVAEFTKQTPEENYEEFRETLGEDASLLDSLDEDILPYTFTVQLKGQEYVDEFEKDLKYYSAIDKIQYSEVVREFILDASKWVNIISITVVAILFVVAIIVISNMTRLSILARADQIRIMRYVGATNAYVKTPYVLEGAFIGLISAALASLIVAAAYNGFYDLAMADTSLNSPLALIRLDDIIWPTAGRLALIGVIVGGVGSYTSVRKFINV